MRRIIAYVMAVMAAAFSWALIATTTTFAAEADWKSSSAITYEGNTYSGPINESASTNLELNDGVKAYTYVDPAPTDNDATIRKIHVIYFDAAADVSTAQTAHYKTYTYNGPANFSDPSPPSDITIANQAAASSTAGTTSCDLSGMGWIVCPISNFLAGAMDYIFDIVSSFLVVRPVATDPNTALFRAWSYMRGFANVAFVIAFLVIIYSQLTNFGISNYGIKKLLPRLIIAAILVNVSYYICAIALDISNVIGYSLQDVFINVRNSLVGSESNGWDPVSWTSITGFILSGGTAATAATIGLFATLTTYGVAGSIFLLLPVLVSGLLSVLTALLILAGRQAMITVLIIISPFAFVAYLLPNTEKWFEKWRSTFLTMLIMFPAFSLVFGGAQLAAATIIQNADNINLIILGMMIQVIPLMITPLLIKLSGSTLGQLANFASRLNKPIMDRTREFTDDRAKNIEARRLGTPADPRRRGGLQRQAQARDHRRRRREAWRGAHTGMADARWANSRDFSNVDQAIREAGDVKKLGESRSELRYNQSRVTNSRVRDIDTQLRQVRLRNDSANLSSDILWEENNRPDIAQQKLEFRVLTDKNARAKAVADTIYDMQKTDKYKESDEYRLQSPEMKRLIDEARLTTRAIAVEGIRSQRAKSVQQEELANALLVNTDRIDGQLIRDYAGGLEGAKGADSALAIAVAAHREAYGKVISERNQLIKHFNLSGAQRQTLAMGTSDVVGTYTAPDGTVVNYTFETEDEYAREAAIETQLAIGSFDDIRNIIEASGSTLEKFKTTIATGIASNKIGDKGLFFGGKTIDDVGQGRIRGHDDIVEVAAKFIRDGKFKAEDLANNDAGAIAIFIEAINRAAEFIDPTEITGFNERVADMKEMAEAILDENIPVGSNKTDAAKEKFEELRDL